MPYARAAAVGSSMIRSTSKPGDPSGVLGRLALGVIEVRRNGDHGLGNPFTEVLTRVVDELAQHLRPEISSGAYCLPLTWNRTRIVGSSDDIEGDGIELAGPPLLVLAADEPLRGIDGALRIHDRLAPGHLPDKPFTGIKEGDHRRRGPVAFGIGDDLGLTAFPSPQ